MKRFFFFLLFCILFLPTALALQEVTVVIEDYELTPLVVTFASGEEAQLTIVNNDVVAHGFGAYDLNIVGRVEPGESMTFDIPTDTDGEFPYYCAIFCGSGHYDMKGTIIIGDGESSNSGNATVTLFWFVFAGLLLFAAALFIKPVRKKMYTLAMKKWFPQVFYIVALIVWILMVVNVLGGNFLDQS